jgi:hypothetical protein
MGSLAISICYFCLNLTYCSFGRLGFFGKTRLACDAQNSLDLCHVIFNWQNHYEDVTELKPYKNTSAG